jgi:glyoxylase-like metal-dependent hydrolase (beta-lactamase superfamily II)
MTQRPLRSFICWLALLAACVAAPRLHADEAGPFRQVHCLKYAEGRVPIEALARGAKPAGEVEIPMLICVAQRPGQVIVLDAGYVDEKFGAGVGIATWTDLAVRLGDVGVKPDEVDLVTISHLHWDHSGGTDRFPKARFVMQRRELEYAALDLPGNPFVQDGFRLDETLDALRL